MPLKLNNSNDSYFTNVFLLNSSTSDWEEVRDLINAQGGGGGGGVVSSATLPLSISNGVLSIDLTAYSSTSQINSMLTNYITNTALSNTLSGYTDTTGLNNILANYTDTAGINTLLSNYTDTTGLTNLLANKQDSLTSGAGIFLSGSTISSYGLRWNTNSTPTITIKDLHFKTGFTVAETFNLSSGNNELTVSVASQGISDITGLQTALNAKQDNLSTGEGVFLNNNTLTSYFLRYQTTGQNQSTPSGNVQTLNFKDFTVSEGLNANSEYQLEVALPTSKPISYITGLTSEVNKISDLIDGPSGLSLGTGTGAPQRMALFEIESGTGAGTFFYGFGLFEGQPQGQGVGVGIYGGTSTSLPDQFATGGKLPDMLITNTGRVGIQNSNPQQVLDIVGNFRCSGSGAGNGVFTGTCTASSFPTSSDQSIKDNIVKADYQEIQVLFNKIDVKTYTRNDGVEGSRIGFIANDFDNNISQDSKFQNIVHKIKTGEQHSGGGTEEEAVIEEENYILGLDYSRLCTLLWGVCKNQEARIQALEAKIT